MHESAFTVFCHALELRPIGILSRTAHVLCVHWILKNIKHVVFKFKGAREIWENMGLEKLIDEACQTNRLGNAIFE
jgi:hypothetical protein